MWTQAKSNRIIYEREKVKDHVMHIERLRQIKPTISINRPKKPSHLKTNAKREMQNLGKLSLTVCFFGPLFVYCHDVSQRQQIMLFDVHHF